MQTSFNLREIDNTIRSIYLLLVITVIPYLSYLTLTHKDKHLEKTAILYNSKSYDKQNSHVILPALNSQI